MDPERLEALARELRGLDLRTDEASRDRFSRDRSPFRRLPAAVLGARGPGDVARAVGAAARLGIPVTARAGGSSVAGQCLGSGLIVDVSALRGIEPGGPAPAEAGGSRWDSVWCGAGETLDEVNAALARVGRAIGPDSTSSRWARVGGLVATNACGSRSLRYGRVAGALLEAEAVLADGSAARLRRGVGMGELPAKLEQGIAQARVGLAGELSEWPRLPREPGGYRLPDLAEHGDALSLLAGSEGTLCVLTRARLATVPRPRRRSLALACFGSLTAALEAAPALAATGASAVEVLDSRLVAAARERGLDALAAGAGAALLVEHLAEEGEDEGEGGEDAVGELRREAPGASEVTPLAGGQAELAWRLRASALSLAGGDGRMPGSGAGGPLALSCFEDPAVPPQLAAGFCEALLGLLRHFGFEAVVYGHAGAGCLHVRPLCDPGGPHLGDRLLDAAEAVCDLAGEWGGTLTGEHGWGLARSHLVELALGPSVYSRFEAVKSAFDPAGVLNPGIVVGGRDPRALVDVSPG